MATKAAKSITINATKYQLANTLAVVNGKIQLKADDVVLSEVTPPTPTLPPAVIKLLTVGVDQGSYNTADVLSYSDVFDGTGASIAINEENLAAGTLPVIFLVSDSSDLSYLHNDDKTLNPIRFKAKLSGGVSAKFIGKDLYDTISQALTEYRANPSSYYALQIIVDYLADIYAESGSGKQGVDNIVTVTVTFNFNNQTASASATARVIDNQYIP